LAVVSFDLDGVLERNPLLSNRSEGVFGHISRQLEPYMPQDGNDPARAAMRLILEEHTTRLHQGRMVPAHDWDDIIRTVATQVGCRDSFDVAALIAEYCERPGLAYLYPGARECLEATAAAGHTLVSITNGLRLYQEPVMRKLGIFELFRTVITPDAVGTAKPFAPIFRAAEAYGSPHIHVGDTLPHDIAGAKRAGWSAIYIVQMTAPAATALPPAVAALAPTDRPAAAGDWLVARLEQDRRWHGYPPAELAECMPDAIVDRLDEVPGAIQALLG